MQMDQHLEMQQAKSNNNKRVTAHGKTFRMTETSASKKRQQMSGYQNGLVLHNYKTIQALH
jgi:hypothetical protein